MRDFDADGTLRVPLPKRYYHDDQKIDLFLESAKRVADYARFLTRANMEEVGHTSLAMRERNEWEQLYTRANERADKAEALLTELADGAPETARIVEIEAARQQLEDKLTEVMQSHEVWHQRCLSLESKLAPVEAG